MPDANPTPTATAASTPAPSPAPAPALDAWLDQAWNDHADAPQAVAARITERAGEPLANADVDGFVGLLVHVLGAHLARWDDAIVLLDRLRAAGHDTTTVSRQRAGLAVAAGRPDALAGLDPEAALAARASAAAASAGGPGLAAGIGHLREALAAAQTLVLADDSPALRSLAVAGNNIALALETLEDRDAAQTAAMVEAARAGLRCWARAGTWLQHERAHYRLASSLLAAGQPADGLAAARECLTLCTAHDAPALERFFGHSLAARCAQAAGDASTFDAEHEAALCQLADVAADERAFCDDELQALRTATQGCHPGRCTCGAVRFRLTSGPLFVHACHCRWCQRETGSAFATNAMIEADRVSCVGDVQPVIVDTPSASGKGQKVARCPHCHVALWSHYAGSGPSVAFVRVGTLLDPDRLPPDIHIFTSTKRPDMVLPPGVPAVPIYYDREAHWPAASLQRRETLLARLKAAG